MSEPNAEEPLDEEQRAAVESADPAIAVLAGPGSGKTRTLSFRTRHLLLRQVGSRALLLTFTNKAAAEMKARAVGTAAVASDRIWASTFHTFGLSLLRAHGELIGLPPELDVLDEDERGNVSREAAASANVDDRYRRWSFLRLRRAEVLEPEVIRFGEAYEAMKRNRGVVDFDDLVVLTAELLISHQQVAVAYGTRFPHLLIDEFQDTNAAQFAVVQALAPHAQTVGVFADDDQAIYRFAGAEAENVHRFINELGARTYPLTVNYRCRDAIVKVANRLVAADSAGSGRQMTAKYDGGEVRLLEFASIDIEVRQVAAEVTSLLQQQTPATDIAVLGRAGYRIQRVMLELRRQGVPVTDWRGAAFDTEERRALRTCLTVIRGPLTDRQAQRLAEFLSVECTDERDPVQFLEDHGDVGAARLLKEVRAAAWEGRPVVDVVRTAQTAIASVSENLGNALDATVEAVERFSDQDPQFSLDHLLAELTLGSIDGAPTLTGGVKIASLHRTKGLQWPHVYLLGLEEGTLPDYRAQTAQDVSEERRACFVGVCRAERRLTLTRVRSDRGFIKRPSRFLREMGFEV